MRSIVTVRRLAIIGALWVAAGCDDGTRNAQLPGPATELAMLRVQEIARLAREGDPSALGTVIPALADRDPVVRTAAVFAVEDLTGKRLADLGPKAGAYEVEGPPSGWREAVAELELKFVKGKATEGRNP